MRVVLGQVLLPLLLTLLTPLAACGSEDEVSHDPAEHGTSEPAASEPAASEPAPSAAAEPAVVAMLSASAVDGQTTDVAEPLPDEQAVTAFADRLDPRLGDQVLAAAAEADVPPGQVLYGQVVAIGCEVPQTARIIRRGADVVVVPPKPTGRVQCLVPITTVALVRA